MKFGQTGIDDGGQHTVLIRNALDVGSKVEVAKASVGTWRKDISKEVVEALEFREACHKIIHAVSVEFEYNQQPDKQIYYLEPTLHLHGRPNERGWEASLDLFKFLEKCHDAI